MRPLALHRATLVAIFLQGFLCPDHLADCQVLPFKAYTLKDGLVSNGVHCLAQDLQGQLWIGTGEGISVYNGYEFTNYRSSEGLALDFVTCLAASRLPSGVIWIGTQGNGISMYRDGRFKTFHPDTGVAPNNVASLVEDEGGTLWCGTAEGGYRLLRGSEKFTKVHSGEVTALAVGADRTVWMATESGLITFSPEGDQRPVDDSGRPEAQHVAALLAAGDRSMLAVTSEGTLLEFSGASLVHERNLAVHSMQTLVEDSRGSLWICGAAALLEIAQPYFDRGNIHIHSVGDGLHGPNFRTAFIDREDNLWIGSTGVNGGLEKLSQRNLTFFPIRQMPSGNFYQHPLAVDGSGRIWAISPDGLCEFLRGPQGNWENFLHTNSELGVAGLITSVLSDSAAGRIFLANDNGTIRSYTVSAVRAGAARMRPVHSYDLLQHAPGPRGNAFLVDRHGRLWVSAAGNPVAVFGRDGRSKRMLPAKLVMPSHDVRAMYRDHDGTLWFGGVEGGISYVREDDVEPEARFLRAADGLPDERIRAIAQDTKGRMLFGTRFQGLVVYENGKFTTITLRDGLISNCIWSIDVDGRGHIWLGTQLGLQAVDENTLRPLPAATGSSGEGVISCKVCGGTVVGYRYGTIVLYDLQDQDSGSHPPPVHITSFETNGRPADLRGPLEFRSDENTCTLGFVGVSFRKENPLHYSYRLLGSTDKWSHPTTQRSVTFSELVPRTYTFEVKAVTDNRVQSIGPAVVTFTILPPPWRTWWAYLLYALAAFAAIAGWRRYEISKIRYKERSEAALRESSLRLELEKQKTRVQIARDLHDEIGSTLSSISYFARALAGQKKSDQPDPDKFIALIAESSSEATEAMRDIIWSIDPANDSWEMMVAKLQRYASDLFESKGISHTIGMPDPAAAVTMDPPRRRHFWLLFKEIVTNVARHSLCTRVKIRLAVEERHVCLTVDDNGVGFDPGQHTTGNGLKNIRSRAQQLGATADLKTSPGAGTCWTIRFPV